MKEQYAYLIPVIGTEGNTQHHPFFKCSFSIYNLSFVYGW